jgi:DNA-binding transcriptional ArsR family regulator
VQDQMLKAVASPRRREILRLVWSRELSSRDIAVHFDVSWPAISQNLRALQNAGLVSIRTSGTSRLYRADRKRMGPLAPVLRAMWQDDLDRLAQLAEAEERGMS